jgi:hypothetical protein
VLGVFGLVLVVVSTVLTVAVLTRPGTPASTSAPGSNPTAPVPLPSDAASVSASPSISASPSASPSVKPSAGRSATNCGDACNVPRPTNTGPCGLPRYPDATCTGVPVGTALSVVNGNMEIRTAGTVIDGKDIRGCVNIKAPGVVIRRSHISCPNFIVVSSFGGAYSGTGLRIEDSEIDCRGGPGTGIADNNVTARRLNIHGCENGFSMDSNFDVQDSYIHDLYNGGGSHTDGIEMEGGSHITVMHNTIFDGSGTSAIITDPTKMSNVLISSNLMAGGAYTLYCPRDSSSNVRVVDNHFSKKYYPTGGAYGPWDACDKVAQLSGNIWDGTGQPVR